MALAVSSLVEALISFVVGASLTAVTVKNIVALPLSTVPSLAL